MKKHDCKITNFISLRYRVISIKIKRLRNKSHENNIKERTLKLSVLFVEKKSKYVKVSIFAFFFFFLLITALSSIKITFRTEKNLKL